MQWLHTCLSCDAPLYRLSDGMLKCSRCRKKRSPERINRILTLMGCFLAGESARQAAGRLGIAYSTVHGHYATFRQLCARICEDEYEARRDRPCEYEEYFYLERSKRRRAHAVFDAQNFLTFDYEGHIYTIVMPSLQQYRRQFIADDLSGVYESEFNRFRRKSRLIRISSRHNNIVRFWDFFEKSIVRYKGVGDETFPLYLKEMEFRFNHPDETARTLLEHYYFRGQP
jgi:transposase-like protein